MNVETTLGHEVEAIFDVMLFTLRDHSGYIVCVANILARSNWQERLDRSSSALYLSQVDATIGSLTLEKHNRLMEMPNTYDMRAQ